jgi:hypothetical protein
MLVFWLTGVCSSGLLPAGLPEGMNRNVGIVGLMFLLCLAGCKQLAPNPSEADDVREAVFRWQFDHNASGQQQKAKAYYLDIGEKGADPSDEFLKRFADTKPPVRKRSAADVDIKSGVTDKATKERGLVFSVKSIRLKSSTEAEAEGGYYEGGLSASSNTFIVKKTKGKWSVSNDKMNWIS